MWHLMSLALSFLCYLLAINHSGAASFIGNNEATEYLARFGYLDQEYQNSSNSTVLSVESFSEAIKDFQSFAGLKETGKLDKETLELMNKPRCGVPDRVRPGSSSTRQKRFALQGSKWPKKQLTYQIKKYTTDMSKADVDRVIAKAFQMWADVTDLTFVHIEDQSVNVDIEILFATGKHGNCSSFDDGPGGTLAHAFSPINGGDVHFDESETWALTSNEGENLLQVATHEFGHSLGLKHTNFTTAVMYPFYRNSSDFELDKDDIEGIQELYGYGEDPLRKLAIELKGTKLELKNIKTKITHFNAAVVYLSTTLIAKMREIVDIGQMPTSCGDLQRMGHKLSGFFLVKGSKKMETVYCDFYPNQNDLQKWIGYADVKSAPIHFYVQRSSVFDLMHTPMPFDLAVVNEGNAMNLTSGIFTAPRPGIYFFSFTGIARFPASSSLVWLGVGLHLNEGQIGLGRAEDSNTNENQWSPLTLQSTLKLKKDDRVWVQIDNWSEGVKLYDSNKHYTHFTGNMLEEEIVASL